MKVAQFIDVIHRAIQSSNETLTRQQTNIFETYFEPAGDPEDIDSSLEAVINDMRLALQSGENNAEAQEHILGRLKKQIHEIALHPSKTGTLKPKTITIQMPEQTADGVRMSEVHVPLLAIIPCSNTKVAETRIKASVNLREENSELLVELLKGQPAGNAGETSIGNTVIDITIAPQESTEGLKALTAGIERSLRSQLPL